MRPIDQEPFYSKVMTATYIDENSLLGIVPRVVNSDALKNKQVSRLRDKVVHSIRNRHPINTSIYPPYGDHLINNWIVTFALVKLCQEEDLDPRGIRLKSYYYWEHPKKGLDLTREVTQSPAVSAYLYPYHYQATGLYLYGNALGIKITPSDIDRNPLPVRTDHTPMDNFDWSNLEPLEVEPDPSIIVISQSGSKEEKRLNDAQVIDVAKKVVTVKPDANIVVVSDKQIRAREKDPKGERFKAEGLEVVASRDINEIMRRFAIAGQIITTDTFWAWLAAGTKVLNPQRDVKIHPEDMLVLYTVASPFRYAIFGASLVESDALQLFDPSDNNAGVVGSIAVKTYHSFFNSSLGFDRTTSGIHSQDISKLKEAIEGFVTR